MTVKTCVFCGLGSPEVKISNEHVIRKALRKYLGHQKPKTTWRQTSKSLTTGKILFKHRDIPKTGFDATVNNVCKTCNEGWLDLNVEIPAERYLASLIIGYPLPFTEDFLYRVSLWAAKTSATRALMDPLPRSIPDEHYLFLKKNLLPPPFTYVFLANTTYYNTVITRHTRLGTLSEDGNPDTLSHFTTFIIGNMALYIIGSSDEHGLHIYIPTIQNLLEKGAMQIWPIFEPLQLSLPQIQINVAIELSEFVSDSFYMSQAEPNSTVILSNKYSFEI